MSKLNQLLIQMLSDLSLEQSLYSECPNVRAVFPQTSLGLAITSPNREKGERSGNEIPRILNLTPVLTWNRQFHLVIGQDMEEQSSH